MLSDKVATSDFWCPLGEDSGGGAQMRVAANMTPAEWAALSRVSIGEWLSEAQVARLQELGLVERVFGQALLTRLGRTTIGATHQADS